MKLNVLEIQKLLTSPNNIRLPTKGGVKSEGN
jgi:hypothetical protein